MQKKNKRTPTCYKFEKLIDKTLFSNNTRSK